MTDSLMALVPIITAVMTVWVAYRYEIIGAYGLASVPMVAITATNWYAIQFQLPVWSAVTAITITFMLAIAGMLVPKDKKVDDMFHVSAFFSAMLLQPLLMVFPWLFGTSEIRAPRLLLMLPFVLTAAVVAYFVVKSQREQSATTPTP